MQKMAEDSDGTLKAVVICEGDLHDPEFPKKFRSLLGKLKSILDHPKRKKKLIKVNKVEPWNSVRVTLSIPKEAAEKLRQLAAEGNTALRALGILSVQLEGDTVISLRLVGQEIVLRSENDNTQSSDGPSTSSFSDFSNLLGQLPVQKARQPLLQSPTATFCANNQPSTSKNAMGYMRSPPGIDPALKSGVIDPNKPIFKSPNTVCPMDGKLPTPVPTNIVDIREFPFESMTQARVIQRRENTMGIIGATAVSSSILPAVQSHMNATSPFSTPTPPPPYPAMSGGGVATNIILNKVPTNQSASITGNIVISSPLLVNLLQNETNPTKNTRLLSSVGGGVTVSTSPNPAIIQTSGQDTVQVNINNSNNNKVRIKNNVIFSNNNNNNNDDNNNHNNANSIINNINMNNIENSNKQINSSYIGGNNNNNNNNNNTMNNIVIQSNANSKNNSDDNNRNYSNNGNNNNDNNNNFNSSYSNSYHSNAISINKTNNSEINNMSTNHYTNNGSNNNDNNSGNIIGNISDGINSASGLTSALSVAQHQTFAGNASLSVPSSSTSTTINRLQQVVQRQQSDGHLSHLLVHQQLQTPSTTIGSISKQSDQTLQSQSVPPTTQQITAMVPQMQKQQSMYCLPPNSHNSTMQQQQQHQSLTSTPLQQFDGRPTHFRQPAVTAFNQMQTNIILPTTNAICIESQHQQQQQFHQQQHLQSHVTPQNSYSSRWPLEPMDSATKSSFQEFTRYQMQYNLSQQQNDNQIPDSIVEQLADLDEITKNDLDSLLPGLNDTDLDTALGLDVKDLVSIIEPSLDKKSETVIPINPKTDSSSIYLNEKTETKLEASQTQIQKGLVTTTVNQNCENQLNTEKSKKQLSKEKVPKQPQFLINPLTGELEPTPIDETDNDTEVNILLMNAFNPDISNSMYSDEENSCSTGFSNTTTSDHSDNERSSNSENSAKSKASLKLKERKDSSKKNKTMKDKTSLKNSLLKEKLQMGLKDKLLNKCLTGEKHSTKEKSKIKIAGATIAESGDRNTPEKIKLRLKLEKSEPITTAYKVDVSFGDSSRTAPTTQNTVKTSSPTVNAMNVSGTASSIHNVAGQSQINSSSQSPSNNEELRVPPLHISLRGGRNSIVIKNSKKNRNKTQSTSDDTDDIHSSKKSSSDKNNTVCKASSGTDDSQSNYGFSSGSKSPSSNTNNQSASTHSADVRTKTPTQSHLLQKFKQKFGEESKVDRNMTRINVEPKIQEQGHMTSKYFDVSKPIEAEPVKRSASDSSFTANGPENSQKKRRLSESACNPNTESNAIKTSVMPLLNELNQTPNTKDIKESLKSTAIESTNIEAPLSPAKIQKAINNNNENSLLVKEGNITIKQQNSGRMNSLKKISTEKSISQDSLSLTTDTSEQKTAEASNNKSSTLSDNIISNNSNNSSSNIISTITDNSSHSTDTSSIKDASSSTNTQISQVTLSDPSGTTTETNCSNSSGSTEIANPLVPSQSCKNKNNTNQNDCNYNNRSSGVNNLPKCDITETASSAAQAIRCSPNSQAHGEDSGIESMDALSEKSPHQTASPQAESKRSDSPKEISKPTTVVLKKEDGVDSAFAGMVSVDIEEALAKMEGISEYMATVCDNSAPSTFKSPKINGDNDHTECQSDTKMEDLVDELITDTKPTNENILLCALTQQIEPETQTDQIIKSEQTKDIETETIEKPDKKAEYDNQEKLSLHNKPEETTILNENCEKSEELPLINTDLKIVSDSITEPNQVADEAVKKEPAKLLKKEFEKKKVEVKLEKLNIQNLPLGEVNDIVSKTVADERRSISDLNKKELKEEEEEEEEEEEVANDDEEKNDKEVENIVAESKESSANDSDFLQQLSIEIPTSDNDNSQRVQTRASSKLESPLDVVAKQSPNDPISTTAKSSKLSLAIVESLSPKKSMKRKRQGSESSTQSSVSDDTPTRSKKQRKSTESRASASSPTTTSTITASSIVASISAETGSTTSLSSSNSVKSINRKVVENTKNCLVNISALDDSQNITKVDDSSDSDEPLIEIAGKVRNSKLYKTESEKILVRNHQKVSSNVTNAQNNTQLAATNKCDDKMTVMSTRRSNRMNAGTKGISGNECNKKTGSASVGADITEARRKTRSAGLESEGRRRRLSRDVK